MDKKIIINIFIKNLSEGRKIYNFIDTFFNLHKLKMTNFTFKICDFKFNVYFKRYKFNLYLFLNQTSIFF